MRIKASIPTQPNRVSSHDGSFRQIVDLSSDAIVVHAKGRIVFANKTMGQMIGVSSMEELLDHSLFDFLHPDTKFLVKARVEAAGIPGETAETFKHQIIPLNGPIVKVETTAFPITWEGSDAIQIRMRPILSSTEYEIRLRESESLFHQLADAMPQIVWMADAKGVVDYHNKKWFDQTGLTEEEANAIGLWKAILHPDDALLAAQNWNRCVRTGEPFQMEYRYKDLKSGGYRWHLGRALPVRNERHEILRWFGTCTDIQDQKLAEIALQEAKEQLAQNSAQLEKLVAERTVELEETVRSSEALNYSIAHDLRSPLRAMMGFSDTLLDEYGPELDAEGREYAQRIAAAAKRMDNLISALLSYGRLNYEELPFGFINTGEMLENLLYELEKGIKAAHARIILTKPFPKVWASVPTLKKIFCELIENALKFRSPERPLQIEIWAEEKESRNIIWIRDNGIGIPPQHHERVFRVLESLHARNQYPGTGIGLAIARRAIERMGGKIGLKPDSEKGSCFWIEFPKALV